MPETVFRVVGEDKYELGQGLRSVTLEDARGRGISSLWRRTCGRQSTYLWVSAYVEQPVESPDHENFPDLITAIPKT
jgi:hypothetical protein